MKTRSADRFFEVPRTVHRTSEGLVDLPILYESASNVILLFEIEASAARRALASSELVPALGRGGRAIAALSFYDYHRTTVGAYREVGSAVFAALPTDRVLFGGMADFLLAPRRRRVGAWVIDLPVTTAAADAAGRELWGYPKFVTAIDYRLGPSSFAGAVRDPGGTEICAVEGTFGIGLPIPALSLVTFSELHGSLVRTPIDVRGATRLHGPGSITLQVGASEHRMAENLRALGVEGARPMAVVTTPRWQSRLFAGQRAAGAPGAHA